MKIYHKKNFAAGVFMLALSLFPIAQGFREGFGLPVVWRMALCMGGALWAVARSLSREFAREDQINERDERNLSNRLRAKGVACDATLWGGLLAALVLVLLDGENAGPCAYVAVGVFLTCSFGHAVRVLTLMYLEKNS